MLTASPQNIWPIIKPRPLLTLDILTHSKNKFNSPLTIDSLCLAVFLSTHPLFLTVVILFLVFVENAFAF